MGTIFCERFDQLLSEYKHEAKKAGKTFSQEDFGEMLGASRSQVFRWRQGSAEPNTIWLARIAQACNVSVDWLIGVSDVRTPTETIAAHRSTDMTDLPPEVVATITGILAAYRKDKK